MKVGSAWVAALLALAAGVASMAASGPPALRAGGAIEDNVAWSGRVLVEKTVVVNPGARLTIAPGAEILFARDAGLEVRGTLLAEGAADNAIRFGSSEPSPSRGGWAGIRVDAEASGKAVMKGCTVTHARRIELVGSFVEITGCRVEAGVSGIVAINEAPVRIADCVIRDMAEQGIAALQGAIPLVEGNRIAQCALAGIYSGQDSAAVATGNTITGCATGIRYEAPAPACERNVLQLNEVGISIGNVGAPMPVRGNRFSGNGTGLSCEQFSSPLVTGNAFDNNGRGLACVRSSSPSVSGNGFTNNGVAIFAEFMSAPKISGNAFTGNREAVSLKLSSYARINGNNFDNNAVQLRLDFMSHDWELRAGRKPDRGESARHVAMLGQGRATAEGIDKNPNAPVGTRSVDATGNWWGAKDTAEMEAAGAGGNIGSIVDGHDHPTQAYEGYPGEYAQDRVDFSGWKSAPIPGAGLRGGTP
jgi:hypothetical protein